MKKRNIIDRDVHELIFGRDCSDIEPRYVPPWIPLYSTMMQEAWRVVEEMERKGFHFSMNSTLSGDEKEISYKADFYSPYYCQNKASFESVFAAYAICMAAVKLIKKNI